MEEDAYKIPSGEAAARRIAITTEELAALLSGIDLSTAPRRKRYRRAQAVVLKAETAAPSNTKKENHSLMWS